MSIFHLPKRFFGSLGRSDISAEDLQWVNSNLLPTEQALFARMSKADRRHAVLVARRVVKILNDDATRPVIAAALLHDVGKIESDTGVFVRVMATLAGSIGTRDQINQWATESGWIGRAGKYLQHNETGAALLQEAGSDELTIKWAREHELKHTEWTIPENISNALWKADNI